MCFGGMNVEKELGWERIPPKMIILKVKYLMRFEGNKDC